MHYTPNRRLLGAGSDLGKPIGAPGFEPGTSPTRTVRATRLRHAPKGAIISETLALLALVLALLFPAPAAADPGLAPPGFLGIAPQGVGDSSDYALMQSSGVTSARLPMYWSSIEPRSPLVSSPDFEEFDRQVRLAAEHEITVFPFVFGTPRWVAPRSVDEPASSPLQLSAWTAFLRQAEWRYGPFGSFWRENPELPFLPIRRWEIWNEENIVTFAAPTGPSLFAKLVRASGRVLHEEDPGAQVILGGLYGRPLQIPPNVGSGNFLSRFYREGNVKPFFDGVALHPYVADVAAMRGQILNLRRVMGVHHDSGTPIYLTEMGWGSASYHTRWERGLIGQARDLNDAMTMLVDHRTEWRIGGVWWFSWADESNACQFCGSAGLLTANGEAKPAWYLFNEWTGGDPETVPRASLTRLRAASGG